jgi:hypothetical protein
MVGKEACGSATGGARSTSGEFVLRLDGIGIGN